MNKKYHFCGKTKHRETITFSQEDVRYGNSFESTHIFEIKRFKVEKENRDAIRKIHFGLTNFIFAGDSGKKSLELNLPDLDPIIITPLCDYETISEQLNDKKTINVTSELIIIPENISIEDTKEIATPICYLLSICRGSKIAWNYYTCYDKKGDMIYRVHEKLTNFPLSALSELIRSDGWGVEKTNYFLKQAYLEI